MCVEIVNCRCRLQIVDCRRFCRAYAKRMCFHEGRAIAKLPGKDPIKPYTLKLLSAGRVKAHCCVSVYVVGL